MSTKSTLDLDKVIKEAAVIVGKKLGAKPEVLVKYYSHPMDGFELAKELDRHEFWDTSIEDVEILHDMEHVVTRLLGEGTDETDNRLIAKGV